MDNSWKRKSKAHSDKYKKLLDNKRTLSRIKELPEIHDKVFSEVDCLDCAACCKNHSPTFKATDVRRISKFLNISEREFELQYLKVDEENDMVLKSSPCNFLNQDNTCQIYEVRPLDCARYPYTDEDIFLKHRTLTLSNAKVCPAVHKVLEHLLSIG